MGTGPEPLAEGLAASVFSARQTLTTALRTHAVALLACGLAVALAYGNSVHDQFVWDDVPLIQQDERLRSIDRVGDVFSRDFFSYSEDAKTLAGDCGCGAVDEDFDGDTVSDCIDGCPTDINKDEPGQCGCNAVDSSVNEDGDTALDCVDNCLGVANDDQLDTDRDGAGDACDGCNDADRDGYGDGLLGNADCSATTDDCDDADARRSPATGETCDGVDNDCNDAVDDGDPDGDGIEGCFCTWQETEPAWIDITETGSLLGDLSGSDDASAEIAVGFDFPYFGQAFDTAHVSTNGFLVMGASSAGAGADASFNQGMPDPNVPNGVLAALWDDLINSGEGIYYEVQGDSPDRRLIVTWQEASFAASETSVTFQAILEEDGGIQLQYLDTGNAQGASNARGESASIGIENPAGTHALNYSVDSPSLAYPRSLRLVCQEGCGLHDPDADGDGVPDCFDH